MQPDQAPGEHAFPTFTVEDIAVAAIDLASARDLVGAYAKSAPGQYVTVTGAHGIVESVSDAKVRAAHQQALMVVPDGMPLVWLGKSLGFDSMTRVYGPDLMEAVFASADLRLLRHFFYGANPAVIARLADKLRTRFGEFNLAGTHSPPMRPLGFIEDDSVIAGIRDSKPDIVWIGLSTPKQEIWMQTHMPKIGGGIAIGVGAAFDLLSGATVQAPRWIQRSGFEWLFRLAMEPRRLFKRYAVVVPLFSFFAVKTLLKRRGSSSGKPPAGRNPQRWLV